MNSTNGNGLHLEGTGAAYIRVSSDEQDTLRQYELLHAFEKRYGVLCPSPSNSGSEDEGWGKAMKRTESDPTSKRLMKLPESGRVQVDCRGSTRTDSAPARPIPTHRLPAIV